MELQEIKESFAKERGFSDWEMYKTARSRRTIRNFDLVVTTIANRYASEANKELVDEVENLQSIDSLRRGVVEKRDETIKELQQSNKELVEMLEYFLEANILSVEGDELAKELINKYKSDEQGNKI